MSWYEDQAQYAWLSPLPREIEVLGGPYGVALVDVFREGRTTPGWGLRNEPGKPGFMDNYVSRVFRPKPRVSGFEKGRPFAIVMRSVRLVMIDIDRHTDDGGADGFVAAAKLDLPPTLAETSKSGSGRHLFYSVPDTWDEAEGFAMYDDVIGLVPGVDVRALGCSYRYPSQRWSHHEITELPEHIAELLTDRKNRKIAQRQMLAATAASPDTEEALIVQHTLLAELAKPIPNGKRNTSLFAIGTKLRDAGVDNWENKLLARAEEVGLEDEEATKIVSNIQRYG